MNRNATFKRGLTNVKWNLLCEPATRTRRVVAGVLFWLLFVVVAGDVALRLTALLFSLLNLGDPLTAKYVSAR